MGNQLSGIFEIVCMDGYGLLHFYTLQPQPIFYDHDENNPDKVAECIQGIKNVVADLNKKPLAFRVGNAEFTSGQLFTFTSR